MRHPQWSQSVRHIFSYLTSYKMLLHWVAARKKYPCFHIRKETLHPKKSIMPLMSTIQSYLAHLVIFPGNLLFSQTLCVQWTWIPGHLLGILGHSCCLFYTVLWPDLKPKIATAFYACHFTARQIQLKVKQAIQRKAKPYESKNK